MGRRGFRGYWLWIWFMAVMEISQTESASIYILLFLQPMELIDGKYLSTLAQKLPHLLWEYILNIYILNYCVI